MAWKRASNAGPGSSSGNNASFVHMACKLLVSSRHEAQAVRWESTSARAVTSRHPTTWSANNALTRSQFIGFRGIASRLPRKLGEFFPQLSERAVHPHFHGADTAIQDPGDFLILQVLKTTENQHLPRLQRQSGQRRLQKRDFLALPQLQIGSGVRA